MTREEALNKIGELVVYARAQGWDEEFTEAFEALSAETQKMGKWIRSSLDTYAQGQFLPIIREVQECSACHVKYTGIRHINARFCPGCGAKMSENPTGSSCTDCILDGTDACSRGAGRAVDGRVCEDFVGESED